MLTLTFLICLQSGECFPSTPPIVFQNKQDCESAAWVIIDNNRQAALRGDAPPHVAYHQCVEWGEPA
jgi:hypothetical protein